jgi:spore coat polysaccharide biosynthesis protein SpsF (cytidylyltransferase family)
MSTRVLAVVQARLGSTRLPGKALADIAGRPMLAHVVERAAAIPGVDEVVGATTTSPDDDAIATFVRERGIACVRGSVEDVLDRFRTALRAHPADAIARLTGDCPLLDPDGSGRVVAAYRARPHALDYVSNVHPPSYPDGLDTEVVSAAVLEIAWREARLGSDREHVTPYVWRRPDRFRIENVAGDHDLSALRWTVDDPRDLEFVRAIHAALPTRRGIIGMREVLELLRARPELASINAGIGRNEGFARSRLADLAAAGPRA